MDTSRLAFPKPRPAALETADRRKARKSVDEKESAKVKVRSGGLCEVFVLDASVRWSGWSHRCTRTASHVHHMMGGNGVRGRGASARAENKLHVCDRCHRAIHAHVLVPDGKHWRRVT